MQLCSGLAGLADSRNAVLYAVHAMQLYRVQGLTPPIHTCAVRVMNFGAETKFEKGASDRNSPSVHRSFFCGDVIAITSWAPDVVNLVRPCTH